MLATLTNLARRTRQHHAIEHAAIHLLTQRVPGQRFSGLSDPFGFTLMGEADELTVRRAVGDALLRLQAGESGLAIHPNCGTNLATTGLLVTVASLVGTAGRRPLFDKFGLTLLLVIPALILARPAGTRLQHYTTLADVTDRWLADIQPIRVAGAAGYRVQFE
ncbi:MAG: hypothetical protein KDD92_10465 [Caldilineaceae bacterium]|nr:hypothetical protein [Caldilineaceae bacterium]